MLAMYNSLPIVDLGAIGVSFLFFLPLLVSAGVTRGGLEGFAGPQIALFKVILASAVVWQGLSSQLRVLPAKYADISYLYNNSPVSLAAVDLDVAVGKFSPRDVAGQRGKPTA